MTHYPFLPIEQQFAKKSDQTNVKKVIEQRLPRKLNRDTTKGMELQRRDYPAQKAVGLSKGRLRRIPVNIVP